MKKVLVFNGCYIPAKKYGGPLTSMVNTVNHCSDEFEFYIVSSNHDFGETKVFENIKEGWNKVGKANVIYTNIAKLKWNFKGLAALVDDVKPDAVWLIGIIVPFTKWPLAKICRSRKIPYLISPRGEVCENAYHTKHKKKILVTFIANLLNVYKEAYFHSTSDEETAGIIKYFKGKKERIFLVPNIPNTLQAKHNSIEKKEGALKIIFIARIHRVKNLLIAIKAVNKMNTNVLFDIYGPTEDEEYWEKCREEIRQSPPNVKISYCGALKPEEVVSKFETYHCFLFPTAGENFGHVIAEALSMSCPIIISKGTTPWDDVDNNGGFTCDIENIWEFTDALEKISAMNETEYNKLKAVTAEYYDSYIKKTDAVGAHKRMLRKIAKS